MRELVFDVTRESGGGYSAECRTASIYAQGETWDSVRANAESGAAAFYFDQPAMAALPVLLVCAEPPER